MSDPLLKYYPIWIKNCQESIRWIESGERTVFYRERNWPIPSAEKDAADVVECQKHITRYEHALCKEEN
jgi:hypothetical protein